MLSHHSIACRYCIVCDCDTVGPPHSIDWIDWIDPPMPDRHAGTHRAQRSMKSIKSFTAIVSQAIIHTNSNPPSSKQERG